LHLVQKNQQNLCVQPYASQHCYGTIRT
jgi:hypothetical protein